MASEEKIILMGVDFSDGAARALQYAVQLAERLHNRLHLIHIYEPISMVAPEAVLLTGEVQGQIAAERQERVRLLEEWVGRQVAGRVPVTTNVVDGLPLDSLLGEIGRVQPELVVVGSHGRGAILRMLMGSVSTALCRRSPVPVVVVPPAEQGASH